MMQFVSLYYAENASYLLNAVLNPNPNNEKESADNLACVKDPADLANVLDKNIAYD